MSAFLEVASSDYYAMIFATTPAPTVRPRYSGHPVLRPSGRASHVQHDLLEQITTALAGLRSR